jgi:uncharacterized RmlC-like cupin family protein
MASDKTHLIRASERKRETSQTTGMEREQSVRTPSMWAGIARTAGNTFSGWHHHGAYESVIYVLRGRLRLEFGKGGQDTLEATAGDTLYVARCEVHREGNPGDDQSELVVVRGGSGELVVNVEGPSS